MKFLHIADLHIGKLVNGFSMLEDQEHILTQILACVEAEQPRAVVLAGDIYDRPAPGTDAVRLFDRFLTDLAHTGATVLLISGNHDSPERLGFAGRLLREQSVYLCGAYEGAPQTVRLDDPEGTVCFHLLPFLRPAEARRFHGDAPVETYADAVRLALRQLTRDSGARHVLVAHQFVVGRGVEPERSESETFSVGGVDSVDADLFSDFDYVALGHLHGPQRIGRETVRYAGSPLKYSFSECRHQKSACLVTLAAQGGPEIQLIPLRPRRDLRKIRGPLAALMSPSVVCSGDAEDYLHVTLTDEDEPTDALDTLRSVYPNVMILTFDNARTRALAELSTPAPVARADPQALFMEFFAQFNGRNMNEAQARIVRDLLTETGGNA